MAEIPESVMEEARAVVAKFPHSMALDPLENRAVIVARAILAAEKRGKERERERCVKIAEQKFTIGTVIKNAKGKPYQTGLAAIYAADCIAAAIRKGSD